MQQADRFMIQVSEEILLFDETCFKKNSSLIYEKQPAEQRLLKDSNAPNPQMLFKAHQSQHLDW